MVNQDFLTAQNTAYEKAESEAGSGGMFSSFVYKEEAYAETGDIRTLIQKVAPTYHPKEN